MILVLLILSLESNLSCDWSRLKFFWCDYVLENRFFKGLTPIKFLPSEVVTLCQVVKKKIGLFTTVLFIGTVHDCSSTVHPNFFPLCLFLVVLAPCSWLGNFLKFLDCIVGSWKKSWYFENPKSHPLESWSAAILFCWFGKLKKKKKDRKKKAPLCWIWKLRGIWNLVSKFLISNSWFILSAAKIQKYT